MERCVSGNYILVSSIVPAEVNFKEFKSVSSEPKEKLSSSKPEENSVGTEINEYENTNNKVGVNTVLNNSCHNPGVVDEVRDDSLYREQIDTLDLGMLNNNQQDMVKKCFGRKDILFLRILMTLETQNRCKWRSIPQTSILFKETIMPSLESCSMNLSIMFRIYSTEGGSRGQRVPGRRQ